MRLVRIAALVGSLVLLVATTVSVVNRRSDLQAGHVAAVEQSTSVAATSIRTSIDSILHEIALVALVAEQREGNDDIGLARQLIVSYEGAEACVGSTSSGCTGSDLLSITLVAELVARTKQRTDSEAASAVTVDPSTDSLIFAGQSEGDAGQLNIAVRVPLEALVTSHAGRSMDDYDANVDLFASPQTIADDKEGPTSIDDEWIVSETIGSGFEEGSVVVTSKTSALIGVAGEASLRFGLLFLLGAVLLGLAGWTFRLERRRLERRATTDDLTGLINRSEFERISELAIDNAERDGSGLCVMVVDLNGFKQINDTLGHQFGDLVLAASSERLVAAVRDTDVVGRWGGDEFVILLPTLAERSAVRNSSERIWHSLADTPVVGETYMTASLGAAIYPRHGKTLDALIRAADVAMYEAKTTGVSHRIADTIATSEALLSDDTGPIHVEVVTDGYSGPDRRQSPVPPPLARPGEMPRPIVPDVPLPEVVRPSPQRPAASFPAPSFPEVAVPAQLIRDTEVPPLMPDDAAAIDGHSIH